MINNKNCSPDGDEMFTGTIDDFLNHCKNNTDDLTTKISYDTRYSSIEYIKSKYDVSDTEAENIYKYIVSKEIDKELKSLINKGLIEIKSYNDVGEPLYGIVDSN